MKKCAPGKGKGRKGKSAHPEREKSAHPGGEKRVHPGGGKAHAVAHPKSWVYRVNAALAGGEERKEGVSYQIRKVKIPTV